MQLQRLIGNRAVAQRIGAGPLIPHIQREYETENWENMKTYNNGSAAKEVRDAFNGAGYTLDEMDKVVIAAMKKSGLSTDRWGHASGDNTQGKQGDTDQKIQACKAWLIQWAAQNPKGSGGDKPKYNASDAQIKASEERKAKEKKEKQASKNAVWDEYERMAVKPNPKEFENYKRYKEQNRKTKNFTPTWASFQTWLKNQ